MSKLYLAVLCVLTLISCSGKQQKLEECMTAAGKEFYFISEEGKRNRLEAEERCVKLCK